MQNRKKRIRALMVILLLVLLGLSETAAAAELLNQNPNTGYTVEIQDYAGLFTAREKQELAENMGRLTKYGSVGIRTVTINPIFSAKEYAYQCYDEMFPGVEDGTLLLIDMYSRELVLCSKGRIRGIVTNRYSDSIMDNVYTYASKKQYAACAEIAFDQVLTLMEGNSIPEPMKYICNAFLALICAILFNYILVRVYTKKREKVKGSWNASEETICYLKNESISGIVQKKIIYSGGDGSGGSGGSGGFSGGGGSSGGGFSGGGGGFSGGSSGGSSGGFSSGSHRF